MGWNYYKEIFKSVWFDLQDLHSSKDKRDTQGVRCVGGGGASVFVVFI